MMTTLLPTAITAVGILGYVGPGPGLTMMAALAGILATLGLALWTVALWPVRAMMRKRRAGRTDAGAGIDTDE